MTHAAADGFVLCRYQPTSPYLKEDLRRREEFSRQIQYMSDHKIETMEDLLAARESVQTEMDKLIHDRNKLRNKIRRASPEDKVTLRGQKPILTAKITDLRQQLKLNQGIEVRSAGIRDTWSQLIANEDRVYEKEKQARKERGAKEREIM